MDNQFDQKYDRVTNESTVSHQFESYFCMNIVCSLRKRCGFKRNFEIGISILYFGRNELAPAHCLETSKVWLCQMKITNDIIIFPILSVNVPQSYLEVECHKSCNFDITCNYRLYVTDYCNISYKLCVTAYFNITCNYRLYVTDHCKIIALCVADWCNISYKLFVPDFWITGCKLSVTEISINLGNCNTCVYINLNVDTKLINLSYVWRQRSRECM